MSEIDKTIEGLASHFHDIYQREAKRQGNKRHEDKYENLSENIKEFDRVLAREVLRMVHAGELKNPIVPVVSIEWLEEYCKKAEFEHKLCACGHKGNIVIVHDLLAEAKKNGR